MDNSEPLLSQGAPGLIASGSGAALRYSEKHMAGTFCVSPPSTRICIRSTGSLGAILVFFRATAKKLRHSSLIA